MVMTYEPSQRSYGTIPMSNLDSKEIPVQPQEMMAKRVKVKRAGICIALLGTVLVVCVILAVWLRGGGASRGRAEAHVSPEEHLNLLVHGWMGE